MVRFSTRMNLLKGSAIRELLALANKPEILSFAGGMPAPELFPVDKIKAATDAVLEEHEQNRVPDEVFFLSNEPHTAASFAHSSTMIP